MRIGVARQLVGLRQAGDQQRDDDQRRSRTDASHSCRISRLAAALTCNVLAPGDVLFSQDASDATLYIIAAGVVTLEHRTELSAPAVVGRIGAGDYIGELGLLTGAPHEITATAQTHSRVYQLSRDAIAPLLSETPALVTAVDRSARRGEVGALLPVGGFDTGVGAGRGA